MRDNETLTVEKIESYALALGDLPLDRLETGLRKASQHCVWYPTPAEIRQFADSDREARDALHADQAWIHLQRLIRDQGFDTGFGFALQPVMMPRKPENWRGRIEPYNGGFLVYPEPFDAPTEYAIRQAGGLQRIASAEGTRDIDFVKRDFLAHHTRHTQTVGFTALSQAEASALLDKLSGKTPITGESE